MQNYYFQYNMYVVIESKLQFGNIPISTGD